MELAGVMFEVVQDMKVSGAREAGLRSAPGQGAGAGPGGEGACVNART